MEIAPRLREAERNLAQADPQMGAVIERVGPCSLAPDLEHGELFPVLCGNILYQQLSGKAAATIEKRFCDLWPGQPYPRADQVADANVQQLRAVGVSRPKASYIIDLAQRCLDGLPTIDELHEMEDEAIVSTLTPIKGIGRWTVEMLLIFRLGRLDVWAIDDLGLRSGMRILRGLEAAPKPKEMHPLGDLWRPFRSVASWYLWRLKDG